MEDGDRVGWGDRSEDRAASRVAAAISEEGVPVAIGKKPVLSAQERAQIEAAVLEAERHTSAEIVPMIVGRSGLYRETHHRAGLLCAVLALTTSLMIEPAWLPWGWHASNAVWLLGITVLAYCVGILVGTWPVVLRLFTSPERMRHKVQMRAERAFFQQGLATTRERTGMLLMVSLLERQVYVLPDQALQTRISHDQWQKIVSVVVERLQANDLAGALCRGIEASGALLARACPSRDGDNPDELPNAVIQDL